MRTARGLALIAALMLCLPLAACASGTSGGQPEMDASAPSWSGDSGGGAIAEDGEIAPDSSGATERSVIRTGEISIEVDDARAASDEVAELAEGLGGRVDEKNVSGSEASRAYLSVRVPSARFDEAFEAFAGVGKMVDEHRSARDVTMQHVDLQARVAALEASIERLTELMGGSATVGELIEAESALAQRQAELDSLRAQLTYLESEVDEATIWVNLYVPSTLPGGGPANFFEAVQAGFESIKNFAVGAVIVLGVLLPWLIVLAVLAVIVIVPILARRRKRNAQNSGSPQSQGSPQDLGSPQNAASPQSFGSPQA